MNREILSKYSKTELIDLILKYDKALDRACEELYDVGYVANLHYDAFYQSQEEWKSDFLAEVNIEYRTE